MAETSARYGYWCIRGLGQTPRYLMEYAGIQYDEKTYNFGDNFDTREDWLKEKFTLDLHFPNLPYLIMGDVKLTQSNAILRFLAKKCGLFPESDEAQWRVDMAEQQAYDLMWKCVFLCYNKEYNDKLKEEYVADFMEKKCAELDKFLGDRKFFGGDQLTYVDFLAYEMLDQHRVLWPEYEKMYHKHPKVEAFLKRMEELPNFAKFLASPECRKWPVWSEGSSYGGPQHPRQKEPVKY